jgi:catechol 2,3-dioxygenase-like lactoylglutathione lyase family enzyme
MILLEPKVYTVCWEGGSAVISGLHHYALEVPDLEVADGFLQDFGLETGEKDGNLVAQCPGRDQEQVRMLQAPAKRLHHVSFTLRPGTVDSHVQVPSAVPYSSSTRTTMKTPA